MFLWTDEAEEARDTDSEGEGLVIQRRRNRKSRRLWPTSDDENEQGNSFPVFHMKRTIRISKKLQTLVFLSKNRNAHIL